MTEQNASPDSDTSPGERPALLDAVRAMLVPLAQLAVSRGLTYATVDEMLRAAFVTAAHAAHPGLPEHRRASRISAATGINRREVARLLGTAPRAAAPARSYPNEVFAHWTTDPQYVDAAGRPKRLPRFGAAPSFESLAQSITRDVHPRSLLEELLRLALAQHDPVDDSVTLLLDAFVPRGDTARMDAFLGANVGDHLSAAVANVLADGRQHFEQAIFAGGLSEQSVEELRGLISAQWKALAGEVVPRLAKLIERDDQAGNAARHRVRIGLFSYHAPLTSQAPEPDQTARPIKKAAPRVRRSQGERR